MRSTKFTEARFNRLVENLYFLFLSNARKERLLKAETSKILNSIAAIYSNNPELIAFLNEIPLTLNELGTQKINLNDLKAYNESLTFILENYQHETHSNETQHVININ